MDKNLENLLSQRKTDNQCIICGKEITIKSQETDPVIYLVLSVIGKVIVHERHIKT